MSRIVSLLLAATIVLLTLLLTRQPAQSDATEKRHDAITRELAAVRAEIEELKAKLAAVAVAPTVPRPSIAEPPAESAQTEQLKLLRDWVAKRRVHLGIEFVNSEGKLDGQFVELFGLNASEQRTLERATMAAQQALSRLAHTHATVSRNAEGNYQIRVPSFIEEGRAVYDRLNDSLQQTLGPKKVGLFSELMGERLEQPFNMFGAQERTLVVKRPDAPAGGRPVYTLEDYRLHGAGSSSSTSTAMSLDQLKKYPGHGGLLELLPSEAGN